jgi:hypothetical protein
LFIANPGLQAHSGIKAFLEYFSFDRAAPARAPKEKYSVNKKNRPRMLARYNNGACARQANAIHVWEGVNHKFHRNTRIAKDCKLAPAKPIMPRLDYISFYLEAGVVTRLAGPGW